MILDTRPGGRSPGQEGVSREPLSRQPPVRGWSRTAGPGGRGLGRTGPRMPRTTLGATFPSPVCLELGQRDFPIWQHDPQDEGGFLHHVLQGRKHLVSSSCKTARGFSSTTVTDQKAVDALGGEARGSPHTGEPQPRVVWVPGKGDCPALRGAGGPRALAEADTDTASRWWYRP